MLLVSQPGREPVYDPIVDWSAEPDDHVLAGRVYRRLAELREQARQGGGDLAVYHYGTPEPVRLLRLVAPDVAAAAEELVEECLVDLYALMREHYLGASGLGLKKAAAETGFAWRDTDPGGAQSQVWLDRLRSGTDPSLEGRLLAHNGDDVRATLALRRYLTEAAA